MPHTHGVAPTEADERQPDIYDVFVYERDVEDAYQTLIPRIPAFTASEAIGLAKAHAQAMFPKDCGELAARIERKR